MTAKEYLSQAYQLEMKINDKLEEIQRLEALATKANTVLDGNSPAGGSGDLKSREKLICMIVDMQREVNDEIVSLMRMKQDIRCAINELPNPRQRIILEKHYLHNKKWSDIAIEVGYSKENIYVMHRNALKILKIPKPLQ